MRELINPDSLLAQLYAVKVLAAQNKAFFYAVLVFEGWRLAFEVFVLAKIAFMRRSEYHIVWGRKQVEVIQAMRSLAHLDYLDDVGLRSDVRKQKQQERNDDLATAISGEASKVARDMEAGSGTTKS